MHETTGEGNDLKQATLKIHDETKLHTSVRHNVPLPNIAALAFGKPEWWATESAKFLSIQYLVFEALLISRGAKLRRSVEPDVPCFSEPSTEHR